MIAASFTSLILPGLEQYGSLFFVRVGFLIGGVFLDQSNRWMPYIYQFITGRVGGADESPEGDALALMLLVRVEEVRALDGVATVEEP